MTRHRSRPAFFSASMAGSAMLAIAVLLSACGSDRASTAGSQSAAGGSSGPVDTGTYPNLNIPPRIAATQITDEQQKTSVGELNGIRTGTPKIGARSQDDSAELRRLGRTHADDTLKAIQSAD